MCMTKNYDLPARKHNVAKNDGKKAKKLFYVTIPTKQKLAVDQLLIWLLMINKFLKNLLRLASIQSPKHTELSLVVLMMCITLFSLACEFPIIIYHRYWEEILTHDLRSYETDQSSN